MLKIINITKAFIVFIFGTITLCDSEYLVYKTISGNLVPITDIKEHKQIYDILMTYQFPMNANPALKLEERLTQEDLKLMAADEQLFLESYLQRTISKDLRLLWVPRILYEHFVINYFFKNLKREDVHNLFGQLCAFRYDFMEDSNLSFIRKILNFFTRLPFGKGERKGQSRFVALLQTCARRTLINILSFYMMIKGISFLHAGYPLEVDPSCKPSLDEYELASDELNRRDLFVNTDFLISRELFNFLTQADYKFHESDKCLLPEQSLRAVKFLADELSEFSITLTEEDKALVPRLGQPAFNNCNKYGTVGDFISFVQSVDMCLAPVFSKILEIEFQAHKDNCFILYRGTDGFEGSLDSPVRIREGHNSPTWLSYGSGIYSSALADRGACAANYAIECKFFYALLIDKSIYRRHILIAPDLNLFHIHPYSTLISLFGNGNFCHPRAKSFVPVDDSQNIEVLCARFLRPPMFLKLFSLNKTPDELDARFLDYCSSHAKVILAKTG